MASLIQLATAITGSAQPLAPKDAIDLTVHLQPENVYAGDLVTIEARLQSRQLMFFSVDLPQQESYQIIANQQNPIHVANGYYQQSRLWIVQVKAPGQIDFAELQASISDAQASQSIAMEVPTIRVHPYTEARLSSEPLSQQIEADKATLAASTWRLPSLTLIAVFALLALYVGWRKKHRPPAGRSGSGSPCLLDDSELTPEIAALMLAQTAPSAPADLRANLEALAYQKMSAPQRQASLSAVKHARKS